MKRLTRLLATVACVAALVLVVLVILVPSLLGYERYVITGGSMTGAIPKGAVIYSKMTPVTELRAGDVITFHPPGSGTAVTHRIIGMEPGPDGPPVFRTRGDANETADPWGAITFAEPAQARYSFHVPLLGYVLAALSIRAVRLALIGVPALLIALSVLWSLWREAGKEVARSREAGGLPQDARGEA